MFQAITEFEVENSRKKMSRKADCRQSAKCLCKAKHVGTFNADNQASHFWGSLSQVTSDVVVTLNLFQRICVRT